MSRFLDARFSALEPYTPGEQPRGETLIKLNTNECPYPPSPKVIEAISSTEVGKLRLYSDPTCQDLIRSIAAHFGVAENQVAIGNGSDEILAFAFQAFCGTKGVCFPAVSYGFYPVFAELYGIKARAIPLRDDYSIDINDYLIPGENVVIANPNAPTGLTLSLDEIETILKAHPDDVVLIDEAYVDFGGLSAVSLIDRYDNLLVVQTFSKSRALAGARVGFGLAQSALIQDMTTMKFSFNPYNLDRLAILAGTAAMDDDTYFREITGKVMATRERVAQALKEMGCELTDSKANFLFVRLPGIPGGQAQQRLRKKGLLVRWFDKDTIRDRLRVTIGTDAEMDAFLTAVKEILTEGAL